MARASPKAIEAATATDRVTAAPASSEAPRFAAPVIAAWLAVALLLAFATWPDPLARLGDDPDSLLRLVQIRDFLAGQGLHDLVQRRLDPPSGLALHWSRMIDVPVAALVASLAPFVGKAEALAMTLWPLLLLLGFAAAATWLAVSLAGPTAASSAAFPAAILAVLAVDPLIHFLPGRLDHHNAQLALALLAAGAAANLRRGPSFGIAAGAASAAMLAIGLETLPYVAVIGGAVALLWAFGRVPGQAAAGFGLAFAVALPLFQLVSAPLLTAPVCDALSPAFVLPGIVAGLGLAALSGFGGLAGASTRLAALLVVALLALGAMLQVNPACLAGPYADASPALRARWLDTVAEAQGLVGFAVARPAEALGKVGAVVLALFLGIRLLFRRDLDPGRRDGILLAVLLCGSALLIAFYQIRSAAFANAFALPLLAGFVADIRTRVDGASATGTGSGAGAGIMLVAAWLGATQIAWYGIGYAGQAISSGSAPMISQDVEARSTLPGASECLDLSSAAILASVPAGLVLAPVFFGPAVLAGSAHSVLAGPYHRGGDAILFVIDAFAASPDAARAMVAARGIDYVAFCATAADMRFVPEEAPDGLLAELASGRDVPWLQPVTAPEPGNLRLYRVVPAT